MEGGLYLPMLTNIARQAHIFPNIKHSLVYIGALIDAGCIVKFRIKYVTLIYKNDIFLQGCRNHQNILRYFPLSVDNEDEQLGDNKK